LHTVRNHNAFGLRIVEAISPQYSTHVRHGDMYIPGVTS
jgi:hypothetical protein